MSTIAMVLLCLVAGIMGLMVNFGQRGLAAARTFSGDQKGFLHRRDDHNSFGTQEKNAKEHWENSAQGKDTSLEDASLTKVAINWVKHDGLPKIEGADIDITKDDKHTLEEMKTACQSKLDCVGFAFWPKKGWWFPKKTGTGFDPATANYSQKHSGEVWEWHYLSDRVQTQAIHLRNVASTTELPILAVRRTPAEEQALKKWQSIIKQSHHDTPGKTRLSGSMLKTPHTGDAFEHAGHAGNQQYNHRRQGPTW